MSVEGCTWASWIFCLLSLSKDCHMALCLILCLLQDICIWYSTIPCDAKDASKAAEVDMVMPSLLSSIQSPKYISIQERADHAHCMHSLNLVSTVNTFQLWQSRHYHIAWQCESEICERTNVKNRLCLSIYVIPKPWSFSCYWWHQISQGFG